MNPKPGLWQASGLLFAMLMANNLCNYLFHALASRSLGPGEYGALVSMLALLTVLGIPSQALQTVMARRVSVAEVEGRHAQAGGLARKLLLRVLLAGACLGLVLVLIRKPLAEFFRLSSAWPLVAAGLTAVVMLATPVLRGVLQGLQRFGQLGANLLADGMGRLLFGGLLLALGAGTTGAVGASAAGCALALVLAAWALRPLFATSADSKVSQPPASGMYSELLPVTAIFGAFLLLSTLDVLAVKHFFPPESAGYYSAGSLVGKAFLFLPLAVANVLFPKVSAQRAQARPAFPLLQHSLLVTVTALLVCAALVWWLAPWIVWTLFGRAFVQPLTLTLVRGFGLAFTPLSLVYLLIQYNLAAENRRFLWLLVVDLPVLLAGLILFHATLVQVLWVVGANHLLLFLAGFAFTPRRDAMAELPLAVAGG
jgi:O-antigen/teichoic acid export membrane protein